MGADEVQQFFHFLITDERPLHTAGFGLTNREEQHIAAPQQFFGTAAVKDGTRVNLTGHRKGNTGRHIGLDDTRDNVNGRTLRSQHHMNTCRTRLLCQTADGIFYIMGCNHHQIRELVNDDDNRRHLILREVIVIALHIADTFLRKLAVTLLHFLHRPVEHRSRFLGIGNHRHHQMRYAVIIGQLDHLGVHEDEFDFIRLGLKENTRYQRVNTHRLTGTRGTSHQQVRHLAQVGKNALSADIHAQAHRKFGFCLVELGIFQNFTELYTFEFLVRNFDTNSALAGNLLDTHGRGCQPQGNIVGQIGNLADLHPRRRLQLVAGNCRAMTGIQDRCLDLKIRQSLLQGHGVFSNLFFERRVLRFYMLTENFRNFGQFIRLNRRRCRFDCLF